MKTFLQLSLITLFLCASATGQWSYQPVHEFVKPGAQAKAPLTIHSNGVIYGTTTIGGAFGGGTIFRLVGGNVETLVNLDQTTGTGPTAGLVTGADGNLYGTCTTGGANLFGTLFRVSPAGVFTKLRDFTGTTGATVGSVPGELVLHSDGSFYGITGAGGSGGFGTVFKLTTANVYTVLTNFTGTSGAVKGSQPVGRLAFSGTNLYGLTRFGGTGNFGTAYRITTGGTFTNLFDFTGTAGTRPGANPDGGLVLHSSGNLFGTAERGGTNTFGTAFRLTTENAFTLLHHFADATTSQPVGELVEGSDGQLYGATAAGGSSGFGGIFRISTAGVHELRHTFTGSNGSVPQSGLVRAASGTLLGITSAGGAGQLGVIYQLENNGPVTITAPLSPALGWHPSGAPVSVGGDQWAFPIAFGGTLGGGAVVSWSLTNNTLQPTSLASSIGSQPDGSLVPFNGEFWGVASSGGATNRGASFSFSTTSGITLKNSHVSSTGSRAEGPFALTGGQLYGVAREGGAEDRGTVFQLNSAGVRNAIFSFSGVSNSYPGRAPRGPLVQAANSSLYGMTELGGSSNLGVIYKLTLPSSYQMIKEFDANDPSNPNSPRSGFTKPIGGLLYGTTAKGGTNDNGTIIRLNPNDDSLTTVASFSAAIGAPEGELIAASDGSILGFATSGTGGIFRYHPSTGLQIIATLTGTAGAFPGSALSNNTSGIKFTGGLAEISNGEYIGLTSGGGAGGGGVLFRLINPAASPLNAWKVSNLAGANSSDLADPDRDGIQNIVEYVLGSNPLVSSSTALPSPVINNGFLQITLPRNPARSDVNYFVESNTSLTGNWTTIASSIAGAAFTGSGYVSGETAGSSTKSVIVRIPTAISSNPRNFLRIRVEN